MVDIENRETKIAEQNEKALQIITKIAQTICSEAEVKMVFSNQEYTTFDITRAEPAIIIGKHGHTLDAIQYLVNLILNKDKEQYDRRIFIVDIDGYRKRREESLQRYAMEKAQLAKKKGDSVALYYMNSIERKLVHMALQDDNSITTYSEGNEPYRRIIIKPILIQDENEKSS